MKSEIARKVTRREKINGVFSSAFVELILDIIDFVRINLVRIDFEIK